MRGFFRNASGSSAVEFGLTAPILIFTVLGGLEYGLMFYTQAAMQDAARDSVRQISLGQMSETSAPTYACDKLPSWAKANCTAAVSHSNAADPKSDVITVSLNVPAAKATVISFFTTATGGFSIKASAAMRREDVL